MMETACLLSISDLREPLRGLGFASSFAMRPRLYRAWRPLLCLSFSAHLPLMILCTGGFKYLEFVLEVSASLAGRSIRLTGK